MNMALFFLKLENRPSMVGWITQVTPGDNAAWYSDAYRLNVGDPITAGASVIGALKIEPRASLSAWSVTVKFFQGATVIVRFGTQRVNDVLEPVLGAVPGPRLQTRATPLPPARTTGADQFAGVVSIIEAGPASGSAWTDTLPAVTADRPLLRLSVENKTSSLAGVGSVKQEGVWEDPSGAVPSLREGAWIAGNDGRQANVVTATYELVRNRPFLLDVVIDVGGPTSVSAGNSVEIRIRTRLLQGGLWDFSRSVRSGHLWLRAWGTLVATDWGIDFMITLKRKREPKSADGSWGAAAVIPRVMRTRSFIKRRHGESIHVGIMTRHTPGRGH